MEDRETPRMHKYGESRTNRIMMATVPHVTDWAGRTKYQAAWILLNRVYIKLSRLTLRTKWTTQILCGRNAALSLVIACARRSYSCHNTGQNGCQATKRLWTQIASILQNKTWSYCSEHQCSVPLYHHGLIYCAHL